MAEAGKGSSRESVDGNSCRGNYELLDWTTSVEKWGSWGEKDVCLRPLKGRTLTMKTKVCAIQLSSGMVHPNVLRFFGFTFADDRIYIVSEHAAKGCLTDVLKNDRYKLDDTFKFGMAIDIATGMAFLHGHDVIHARLTSRCCLLDSHFSVKIANWEVGKLQDELGWGREHGHKEGGRKDSRGKGGFGNIASDSARMDLESEMFWMAPELFQHSEGPNKKSDVYSFGILLYEIFSRMDPYAEYATSLGYPKVIHLIRETSLRPQTNELSPNSAISLMQSCWTRTPCDRPTFGQILKTLKQAIPSKKTVIESMMETLEGYVSQLEERVKERTSELASVNRSLETLLPQHPTSDRGRSAVQGSADTTRTV